VPLRYIPTDLWNEMKSLTVESMTPALSPWLAKGDIKAIIQRRDKMEKMVDDLVKKYGAENVFVKKT
jgi:N-methylhydantoinase B/oxoprolinase/acetone carboxylase alpha subunit